MLKLSDPPNLICFMNLKIWTFEELIIRSIFECVRCGRKYCSLCFNFRAELPRTRSTNFIKFSTFSTTESASWCRSLWPHIVQIIQVVWRSYDDGRMIIIWMFWSIKLPGKVCLTPDLEKQKDSVFMIHTAVSGPD